jgi:hypothetical protein
MDKREAAKELRDGAFGNGPAPGDAFIVRRRAAEAGAAALEREAAREEAERPKVTLEEQETAIRLYLKESHGAHDSDGVCRHVAFGNCDHARAGASTLKRLAEEGGRLLVAHRDALGKVLTWCNCGHCGFLRSLGVEPQP